MCGIDGCTERFRQRGRLCVHRKTHENYVPKSYFPENGATARDPSIAQLDTAAKSPSHSPWPPSHEVFDQFSFASLLPVPCATPEQFLMQQVDFCCCEPSVPLLTYGTATALYQESIPGLTIPTITNSILNHQNREISLSLSGSAGTMPAMVEADPQWLPFMPYQC